MSRRNLILVMMVMMVAGLVYGGTEDSVTLTVTVAPSAEIQIWYQTEATKTYNFGSNVPVNTSSITVASFTVKNNSSGLTEDWQIRASNAYGTGVNWTLATSTTTDQYTLQALLNAATKPSDSDFGSNDYLSTSNTAMDTTHFAGSENGESVASGETRGLWFRIVTPSEVTDTSQKTIYVTVVASQAG